jgi:hypothetical protein
LALSSGVTLARGGEGEQQPSAPSDDLQERDSGSEPSAQLKESLQQGRFWMNFRYRFESVDQEGFDQDAQASTLRTRLGYESAAFHHWTGLVEFSGVSALPGGYGDYDDTINGKTDYPVIADPEGAVVNLAHATYDDLWGSTIRIGRQRLQFDNSRFIGSALWRQTEQVFDAVSIHKPDLAGLDVVYAYVDHINRVVGPRSPKGDLDSNSHFLHASRELEGLGEVAGYGYYLDVPDPTIASTFTYGLRLDGERGAEEWAVLYTAELAHQTDAADNPSDVDVGYLQGVLGGRVQGFTLKGGYEVLGGGDSSLTSFQTPLAARHGPNGWADKFLVTPAGGLEDRYLSAGFKLKSTEFLAAYHDFSAESGPGGGYGTELDLRVIHKFENGVELGVKYADYSSDRALDPAIPATADTQKFWLWMYYSF